MDSQAAAKVATAVMRLATGNTSNVKWFGGIGEYRIDWGPAYRIYLAHGGAVAHRAIVLRHKTQQPVQFELTDQTRESVAARISHAKLRPEGFLFPSRVRQSSHLTKISEQTEV